MPRYLKRWSRWCQQAFFLLVRCCCSLERELSALSYSHSALDVWSWSSLRMSSKHSICFLGCSGDRIIASGVKGTETLLGSVVLNFQIVRDCLTTVPVANDHLIERLLQMEELHAAW